MKDSHIGSYGTLALITVSLARWSAIAALMGAGTHWAGLVASAALSRGAMAAVMAALPNARQGGLSAASGRPTPRLAALATGIALLVAFLATGATALAMTTFAALAALGMALLAQRRIGGQTGDILGATQMLAETAALAAAAALLA